MNTSFDKWLRLVCAISLVLNLFLGGVIAGGWLARDGFTPPMPRPGGGPPPPPLFLPSPGAMMRVLPPKDQGMVKQELDRNKDAFHERINGMLEANKDVAKALKADPFDREALAQALAGFADKQAGISNTAKEVFCNIAENLDQNGRNALAELLLEPPMPHGGPPPHGAPSRP